MEAEFINAFVKKQSDLISELINMKLQLEIRIEMQAKVVEDLQAKLSQAEKKVAKNDTRPVKKDSTDGQF